MEPRSVSLERISELLHATLHEVAGPAGQISRIAELIGKRTGDGSDGEVASCMSHLTVSARRLAESLRGVSRYAEVFDTPYELTCFPLIHSLNDAKSRLELLARSSGAAITSGDLPDVEADSRRLALLFYELFSNGLKFCVERAAEIHVSAKNEEGVVVVSVADNGIGIEPNHTERIFKPFVKRWGDRFPGSGIGLGLAKVIVEMWGGRIWVDSVVGSGSTFRFTLPGAPTPLKFD